MDIYKYAEDMNYCADYYDANTGRIYKIQDYKKCLDLGLPTPGIAVTDSFTGRLIGYAKKKEVK